MEEFQCKLIFIAWYKGITQQPFLQTHKNKDRDAIRNNKKNYVLIQTLTALFSFFSVSESVHSPLSGSLSKFLMSCFFFRLFLSTSDSDPPLSSWYFDISYLSPLGGVWLGDLESPSDGGLPSGDASIGLISSLLEGWLVSGDLSCLSLSSRLLGGLDDGDLACFSSLSFSCRGGLDEGDLATCFSGFFLSFWELLEEGLSSGRRGLEEGCLSFSRWDDERDVDRLDEECRDVLCSLLELALDPAGDDICFILGDLDCRFIRELDWDLDLSLSELLPFFLDSSSELESCLLFEDEDLTPLSSKREDCLLLSSPDPDCFGLFLFFFVSPAELLEDELESLSDSEESDDELPLELLSDFLLFLWSDSSLL